MRCLAERNTILQSKTAAKTVTVTFVTISLKKVHNTTLFQCQEQLPLRILAIFLPCHFNMFLSVMITRYCFGDDDDDDDDASYLVTELLQLPIPGY